MRVIGLDILRGLAIILVLFRHSSLESNSIKSFGWLGVDLFFVISGALISGIIFKEYLASGGINIKRFLLRRGFKIYPSFYFFMALSIFAHWYRTNTFFDSSRIIPEALYFQNYTKGIWIHTWSLDVEEQFYILFAVCALVAIRTRILLQKRTMLACFLLLLAISFILRWLASYPHRNEFSFVFFQTHLRSDGLIIGVMISYMAHFTNLCKIIIDRKRTFFVIAIACLIPAFYFSAGGFIMNTVGLSIVCIGFGLLTLLSMNYIRVSSTAGKLFKVPARMFAFIGQNSYSIYLWHLAALSIANLVFNGGSGLNFALYFLLAIVIGVVLTYAIEKPFLKLRDKVVK